MITIFNIKNKNNFKQVVQLENIKKEDLDKTWIHLTKPSIEEVEKISLLTNINKNLLLKSLDEEESAHIEKEENTTLICVDTVYNEIKGSLKYNTIPLSILINESFIVTTSLSEFLFIDEMVLKHSDTLLTNQKITLALSLLYYNAKNYIHNLKRIETKTQVIESELNKTMKNEGLIEMLNLSTSLVYLSTSISSNLVLISKLDKLEQFQEYESDLELLEDTIIETKQAKETCSIYREILSAKMDAYANIINNNVNSVMKLLAIVTIIVTIPTLIASIYGMNVVNIPLANSENGFFIISIVSIVLSILCAIVLFKYTSNKKK